MSLNKKSLYSSGLGSNSGRIVLHSDLNNFFASVECSNSGDPEIFKKPVAVCGDREARHGIILAKNEKAKLYGIKTGEPINSAIKKCPTLLLFDAHYDMYMRYSRAARAIYREYSDRVEPFGMDEAWIELTGCPGILTIDDGKKVADLIRKRIKKELGVTASVGVSDNKSFAKLASDFKKPDATTVLSPREYEKIISPMPLSEILYVGKSSAKRLRSFGVCTVGQAAEKSPEFLRSILGKNGLSLHMVCNGEDRSPVTISGYSDPAKSVGNSTTPPKDITSLTEAKLILYSLCETVCSRLREQKKKCRAVKLSFRDTNLYSFERQLQLGFSSSNSVEIMKVVYDLLKETINFETTRLRSIGICAIELSSANSQEQTSLFYDNDSRLDTIDKTVDSLRKRFGYNILSNALNLCDTDGIGHIERGYEVFTNLR